MPKTSIDKYGNILSGEIEIWGPLQLFIMHLPSSYTGFNKASP